MFFFSSRRRHTRCALVTGVRRVLFRSMDTARIGACFMVVVLHVAAMNFGVFDNQWWASNFYDSLTRSCVPVFLMISGVLLLGKQETLAVFFRKRFARILPPLLFWSLFYMSWNTWRGRSEEHTSELQSLMR